MSSTKVSNAISALVHEEKLEVIKQLKVFLEEKMDDVDEINDMIDEFSSTLSLVKVKVSKKSSDKEKRTRKPTFYNHWLGGRLKSFSGEQKLLPEEERVGKNGRMKVIADEWKDFKQNTDEYDTQKAVWDELSSSDDVFEKKEVKQVKKEVAKKEVAKKEVKKEAKKEVKKEVKKEANDDSDSDSDEDNVPVQINSDSEDE
jgi:hypothetical protein